MKHHRRGPYLCFFSRGEPRCTLPDGFGAVVVCAFMMQSAHKRGCGQWFPAQERCGKRDLMANAEPGIYGAAISTTPRALAEAACLLPTLTRWRVAVLTSCLGSTALRRIATITAPHGTIAVSAWLRETTDQGRTTRPTCRKHPLGPSLGPCRGTSHDKDAQRKESVCDRPGHCCPGQQALRL